MVHRGNRDRQPSPRTRSTWLHDRLQRVYRTHRRRFLFLIHYLGIGDAPQAPNNSQLGHTMGTIPARRGGSTDHCHCNRLQRHRHVFFFLASYGFRNSGYVELVHCCILGNHANGPVLVAYTGKTLLHRTQDRAQFFALTKGLE